MALICLFKKKKDIKMNSRERVIGAIERTPIDRIPRFDGFWEDTTIEWAKQGLKLPEQRYIEVDGEQKPIGNNLFEYFNFDFNCMYYDGSMRFDSKLISDDGEKQVVKDRAGYTVQRIKGKASSLHFLKHEVEDFDAWEENKHRFKFDPNDKARVDSEGYFLRLKDYPTWDGFKKIFDESKKDEKYNVVFGYGPYEQTWRHHGYENCLMDLLVEPEMMAEMFEKATDVMIDTIQYMIDNDMKPDGWWLAEDMGGTHTTLFSDEVYKELLYPQHKRIGDFLHKNGIHFLMHSCGKIEGRLPDLIEAGLDVIQAIQANTGMDISKMKETVGDKITFWGNIGEQEFKAGKEAVEAEMRRKIPTAMKNGGFIYHSDHSIPPEVTLETYEYAMKVLDEIGQY